MTNRMNNKCERETERKFKAMPAELLTENNKKMRKRHLIEFFLGNQKDGSNKFENIFKGQSNWPKNLFSPNHSTHLQPFLSSPNISVALLACE
jgi:hypothetical protein